MAAANGRTAMVELLLLSEVPVDSLDSDGRTPLIEAVAANHANIVQLLLQAGANVHRRDEV